MSLCGVKLSSPHRLVVRTSRCGRDNPGSTPGEDIFAIFLSNFRYHLSTRSILANDTQQLPSLFGTFRSALARKQRLRSEVALPNLKNIKETSAFGNGGAEFENK